MACSTTPRMESGSSRLVEARAVRPSMRARTERCDELSATFWWMALLAKRVSAWLAEARMDSTSSTPCARAARTTWPCTADASTGIRAPNFNVAEARGAGAVARAHYLFRMALAAVRNAPKGPVLRPGDGRTGVPELRRNAAIAGVLQHAHPLAAAHLPGDLAAELEVVALIVDGPTPVGLHIDGVVRAEDFFERLFARLEAHVGHADQIGRAHV